MSSTGDRGQAVAAAVAAATVVLGAIVRAVTVLVVVARRSALCESSPSYELHCTRTKVLTAAAVTYLPPSSLTRDTAATIAQPAQASAVHYATAALC
eukprot:15914-Heterococcus_DN1.PRE.2